MKNMDEVGSLESQFDQQHLVAIEHRQLMVLLNVTREISKEIQLDRLLLTIMDEVKKALEADRCTVFLIDERKNELWSKVAHGADEIRFSRTLGVAGHVATSGEILNISDAYADQRFNSEIDRQTGYHTRNMLTFPMKNSFGGIIGVFQVLNKRYGCFGESDEKLLAAISSIASAQVENAMLYEQQRKSFESFIETLAMTIDARDPLTAGHSKRISLYADEIAKVYGLPAERREVLRYAALLHDYGKVSLADEILKTRERFTEAQFAQMRSHPRITRTILEKIDLPNNLQDLPLIAGAHHEKMDGSGYPEGLRGRQIPLESRILAVVDAFDAMTSNRRYTDRLINFEQVLYTLEADSGTHFDPTFVEAFQQISLSRLVLILEDETPGAVAAEDIDILSHYTVSHLMLEKQQKTARSSGTDDFLSVFNKYYRRHYLLTKEVENEE